MASNAKFYDGNKIINTLDLEKQKPAIVMICGNRTAGKTFWCKKYCVRTWTKKHRKFIVLVRFGYQLTGMVDTFFKDLLEVGVVEGEFTQQTVVKNSIEEIFMDGVVCGYVVALNNADSIKRNSTLFTDVDVIFFDEFQSETGKYCPNEIQKFISIYTSVARGGGKQSRYVLTLMCSNNVTLLNPYYCEFDIPSRLQRDTKILRGNGWILEITFNESASEAIKTSGIGRAFANNKYMSYSSENIYLNDSDTFIEKYHGPKTLYWIIDYDGETYGIWNCGNFFYISTQYDPNFKRRYAIDVNDHNLSTILIKSGNVDYKLWREFFDNGLFRFENLKCKQLMFAMLK